MNALGEAALRKLLVDDAALAALVGGRVSWDDMESDETLPSVSLRLLTSPHVPQLSDHSDLANPLVEISAHDATSTGASQLCDTVIAALRPYLNRTVVSVDSQSVRLASVRLVDVQQSSAPRERAYRKVSLWSVWQEG